MAAPGQTIGVSNGLFGTSRQRENGGTAKNVVDQSAGKRFHLCVVCLHFAQLTRNSGSGPLGGTFQVACAFRVATGIEARIILERI
jgi:hypothetical protein